MYLRAKCTAQGTVSIQLMIPVKSALVRYDDYKPEIWKLESDFYVCLVFGFLSFFHYFNSFTQFRNQLKMSFRTSRKNLSFLV